MADTPQHVLLSTLTALEEEGHRLPSGSLPARSLYVLSSDAPPSLAKDLSDRYPNLAIAQVVEGGSSFRWKLPVSSTPCYVSF